MPKYPEFKSKPIKGLEKDEWGKWTLSKLVAREKALTLSSDPEILKKRGKSISKANKGRVNDMSYLNTKEAKENWRKSIDLDKLAERCRDNAKKRSKRVKAYNVKSRRVGKGSELYDYKFIGEFESIIECSRQLNVNLGGIANILNPNHNAKQLKGYTFEYA